MACRRRDVTTRLAGLVTCVLVGCGSAPGGWPRQGPLAPRRPRESGGEGHQRHLRLPRLRLRVPLRASEGAGDRRDGDDRGGRATDPCRAGKPASPFARSVSGGAGSRLRGTSTVTGVYSARCGQRASNSDLFCPQSLFRALRGQFRSASLDGDVASAIGSILHRGVSLGAMRPTPLTVEILNAHSVPLRGRALARRPGRAAARARGGPAWTAGPRPPLARRRAVGPCGLELPLLAPPEEGEHGERHEDDDEAEEQPLTDIEPAAERE